MSDITLNPAQRQPAVADTTGTAARSSQANLTTDLPATSAPIDSISLSPAAQAASATAAGAGTPLSDIDAESASVGLRQSIGTSNLSVSAKQNQAILSLLR